MGVDWSFVLWLNVGIRYRSLHFVFGGAFLSGKVVTLRATFSTAATVTYVSECDIIDVQDD